MRILSTTSEQTAKCPRGTAFRYLPADVVRVSMPGVPRETSAAPPPGVTFVGDWIPARTVTCPCCWARCEVTT